ncbi:hypothetical protein [Cohnella terricola]|uniref:Uncharacterized protein n=1 Tax=Cohnella terricola TaxID=1289167 RepID=A0A559JDS7_9BACL|nr:hypothetical protein [Cohnella terricola]TVX98023.1 hypothetical protein FPZ45_17420 [Cohnella terricola]
MSKRAVAIWLGIGIMLVMASVWVIGAKDKTSSKAETEPAQETLVYKVTIAQKGIDWNKDGKQEKLAILMTEGELRNESEPGPFQGEYYIGRFAAVLTDAEGAELQRLDLTPSFGEDMQFRKGAFELVFDDYNNDGYPEFTIGQYGSSNNFVYNVYTIRPEGISTLVQGMAIADSAYSVAFEKKDRGAFSYRYYDNSRSGLIETTYEWDGTSYRKTGEAPYEETETGGAGEELNLIFQPRDYGFKLVYNERYFMYVDDTVQTGNTISVPFGYMDTDPSRMIRTLERIDPELRKSVLSSRLTDVSVVNDYGVSSLLKVFGPLDGRRIVYSNVKEKPTGLTYSIEALDPESGERAILAEGVPSALGEQDFFARNWFSPSIGRIAFNKYFDGSFETVDLTSGQVKRFQGKYKHDWPFYMTIPSPDGTQFWYVDTSKQEFRLLDLDENLVAKVRYPVGLINYPAWIWSEDSRYTALYYTFDKDRKHVIDSEEIDNIAPQGVRIYGRNGKEIANVKSNPKKDEYVEIAGWLPESDSVLLRYFHLDRETGRKENFTVKDYFYKIYDLKKKTYIPLNTVEDIAELRHPEMIASATAPWPNLVADLKAGQIWEASRELPIIEYPIVSSDSVLYIVRYLEEESETEIARFMENSGLWEKATIPYPLDSPRLLGERWLIGGGIEYVDLTKVFAK